MFLKFIDYAIIKTNFEEENMKSTFPGVWYEEKAIEILLKEADVAIKYRILSEIYDKRNMVECTQLQRKLEDSTKAKRLLVYLANKKEYHGATLHAVENSLNILIDMGFLYGVGFDEFDRILENLAKEVKGRTIEGHHVLRYLPNIVIVPIFLRAGVYEEWMIEFVKERIDTIYNFVQQGNYDIYDSVNQYKGIPKSFQGRPIVRPELYEQGKIKLPLEYDIYGFASVYMKLPQDYKNRIDAIIIYIMDKKFQQVADGYGILTDKKKYWALGWDPKPLEFEKEYCYNPLLLKMGLLSNFEVATKSEWFLQALKIVERYKDDNGLYHFPKNYLTEKDSCWILGNHMGVGENRRNKNALIHEGTFRALVIKNNLKNFS